MNGFQNSFAQVFSLRISSAIRNLCLGRLKVKVTLEGQRIKWSYIELAGAITSTFMHGFKNNFAQVFFLLSPLAVKRDITVTILLRCMCMHVCMHACLCMSIPICLGHYSYIYARISKLFNTTVVLGKEKCHLKHFRYVEGQGHT